MSYQTQNYEDATVVPKKSTFSYAWVVVIVIVVIIVIILLLYFFLRETGETPLTQASHIWNIIPNTMQGNVPFAAAGGNLFLNSATLPVNLSLTAPVNPQGQEFIISNAQSSANIVLSGPQIINSTNYYGVNVFPPANTLTPGKVSSFVWINPTTILKLT